MSIVQLFLFIAISSIAKLTFAQPLAASILQENCSIKGSCESGISCTGAGIIGLCPNSLLNKYAIQINGTIPTGPNFLLTSHYQIPWYYTQVLYLILDGDGDPFIMLHIGQESMGLALLNHPIMMLTQSNQYINVNSNLYPGNIGNMYHVFPNDNYIVWLIYEDKKLSLYYDLSGTIYEMAYINLPNIPIISGIIPYFGVQQKAATFTQLFNFSLSKFTPLQQMSYNLWQQKIQESSGLWSPDWSCFSGIFGTCMYTSIVQAGNHPFSEGYKISVNQGMYSTTPFVFKFSNIQSVVATFSINYPGNIYNDVPVTLKNLITGQESNYTIPKSLSIKASQGYYDTYINLSFLITGGYLLVGFDDYYFVGVNVEGLGIHCISSPIWFTSIITTVYPEPTTLGTATGHTKCKVDETNCTGNEMSLTTPLQPGNQIKIVTRFAPESSKYIQELLPTIPGIRGAITMGDGTYMRAAVLFAQSSVSITIFNNVGILIDSHAIYLPENKELNYNGIVQVFIGVTSNNELAASIMYNGKILQLCSIPLSGISLKSFRVASGYIEGITSNFIYSSNGYPAEGYPELVSKSSPNSESCYISVNGKCSSYQVVGINTNGLSSGIYSLIEATYITLPLTIQFLETSSGKEAVDIYISTNGIIKLSNMLQNVSVSGVLSSTCISNIMFNGLYMVLSVDSDNVYLILCSRLVATIPNSGLDVSLTIIFDENISGITNIISGFPAFSLACEESLQIVNTNDNYLTEFNLTSLEFSSPCSMNGLCSGSTCSGSAVTDICNKELSDGFAVSISGVVQPIISYPEQTIGNSFLYSDTIQIFSFIQDSGLEIFQLIITYNQIALIDVNTGIGVGGSLPLGMILNLGSKYRIWIGFYNSKIIPMVEFPYGSNKKYVIHSLTSTFADWPQSISQTSNNIKPLSKIIPILFVQNPYTYSIVYSDSLWYPWTGEYIGQNEGSDSCTLTMFGSCISSTIYMPANIDTVSDIYLDIYLHNWSNNDVTIYFRNSAGESIVTLSMSYTSILYEGNRSFTMSNFVGDKISFTLYNQNSRVINIKLNYTVAISIYINGLVRSTISARGKKFNHITTSNIPPINVRLVRSSFSHQPYWQALAYANEIARSEIASGVIGCSQDIPLYDWYSVSNEIVPGYEIQYLCMPNPDKYTLIFKSMIPDYVNQQLGQAFRNFPGFLQAIVLLNYDKVAYTVIIARNYISFYSSDYNGTASDYRNCAAKLITDKLEFGDEYQIFITVNGNNIYTYQKDLKTGDIGLICGIPFTLSFNSAKYLDQTNGNYAVGIGEFFDYVPNSTITSNNANQLYPLGFVEDKSIILSSGSPFSLGNSMSLSVKCDHEISFGGISGEPQIHISIKDNKVEISNLIEQVKSIGKIPDECKCLLNSDKIILSIVSLEYGYTLVVCGNIIASIDSNGTSIYQIASEEVLTVHLRPDIRLAVATKSNVKEIQNISSDSDETTKTNDNDDDVGTIKSIPTELPKEFRIITTLYVKPSYK